MRAFLSLPRPLDAATWARLGELGIEPPDGSWVRCRTVDEVRAAATTGSRLWLMGQESAGSVGDSTALVLIRAAVPTGCPWVVEGLGERAQAAALALGAQAVVLDGPLWGCEGQLDLSGVRSGRDTALLGEAHGHRVRVLSRGRPEVLSLQDADADVLQRALVDGTLQPAPQSIGGCAPYRGRPVVEAAASRLAAIEDRAAEARAHHPLRHDPLGTGAAVVQGPMANVSEAPHLARAVREAGGLPFCALGALSVARAEQVLADHRDLDAWGAGVIGFDVLPQRDAHLDAVAATGPRPTILAGGSVPLAERVVAMGLVPWLHTPDPAMVAQALDAGLPAVVLEGTEAGGHVGALTSLGLWEDALAVLEAHAHHPLVVLAGGLGDAVSGAFAGAMAARAHRLGCPVALQAGTAFLLTHEIVESGQLPYAYQEAALAAHTTELVGATVQLPLRCAPSPYTAASRAMERRWADEGLDRRTRREQMEHHNLGRARIAAQARERHPDWGRDPSAPHYRPVPVDQQRREGAFTMGQGATVATRLCTVVDVVRALSVEAADLLEAPPARVHAAPIAFRPARSTVRGNHRAVPIAIVGMGAVLPGARDVAAYLDLLLRGVDATGPAEGRWDESRYHGQGTSQTTSRLAGRVDDDFGFDPLAFRIPPNVVPTMDRAQRLALVAAHQAVTDAGWLQPGAVDKRRAAVILGNSMGGEHAKSLAVRIRFREVLDALARDPVAKEWTAEDLDALQARVEARLAETLPPVDVESMAGLLANVIAGRITAWLDWMGGNVVVDAACAASLAAATVAIDGLRSGRFDAVLTGGVDADLSPETYVGFSRTHALSATGSSPFSADADGFVMAEGAAVLALCRLPDALAKGWPVHAVIHGAGVASDGRSKGITAPRAEGQLLALERAWADAGIGPGDLGAIEAHGTGTAVGDRTELGGLARRLRGADHPVWVSSVKSNIGHLKGGAGAAGLVKAALSAATGLAFPSLHAGPVVPEVVHPLAVPRAPAPLAAPYVGVSAFGFGGTDHHVVVGPPPADVAARPRLATDPALAAWSDERVPLVTGYAADSLEALRERVLADQATDLHAPDGAFRVAVCTRPERRDADRKQVAAWLGTSPAHGDRLGRLAAFGHGEPEPVVLLFPGQGAQRRGGIDAAALHWRARQALLPLGTPAGRSLRDWEADNGALGIHLALFATGVAWSAVIADAGLPVAASVGHSLGAFPSLVAAGWLSATEALPLVVARGQALEACPPGAMLAVALSPEEAAEAARAHGLALAAVNGPRATVLAGPVDAIAAAEAALPHARPQRVDVPRAYHSPSVEPAATALLDVARQARFREGLPVWSTRTAAPMEPAPAHDLARAIVDPVRFDDTVTALLDAGHRTFVECGPGSILSRLVAARGGVSVPLDSRQGGFPVAAAALWALGHPQLLLGAPGTLLRRDLPAVPPRRWPAPSDADDVRLATAPEPTVATTPEPVAAEVPEGDARALVVQAICEVTGYPADFVAAGNDLEADLGVDSIRKMEVLGHLERALGVKASDQDLQQLASADLAALVAWVEAREDATPEAVDAPASDDVVYAIPVDAPLGVAVDAPDLPPAALLAWLVDHAPGTPALRGADPVQQALIDGWCRAAKAEGLDVPVREVTSIALSPAPAPLPDAPVVLATGGLTGIVAACLGALQQATGARIVVLGRRDLPAPAGWTYLRCDLIDPDAVAAAVATVGPVDIVVHGAGALADGPATDRSDADRDKVLGAKLLGARHLARALPRPAALWVDMSSITGWFANPHQTLYAAANRALAAETRPAARHLVLGWTAWSEVGMAADERLQRLLRARGLTAIDPEAGGAAFVRLVASDVDGPILVTRDTRPALDPGLGPRTRWAADHAAWQLPLDPASPALADHVVAGRPLVPAAHWGSALLAAAAVFCPDHADWSLSDFVIDGPCTVPAPRSDVELVLERDGDALRARIGTAEVPFARARLEPTRASEARHPRPVPLDHPVPAPYQPDKLFHGPAWRVLDGLVTDADGARGDVRPSNGLARPAELIDAAYQLACTWADRRHGFLALPVGAGAIRWHGPADGAIRLELRPRTDGDRVLADLVGLDAEGTVRLVGRDLELRRATAVTEAP